MTVHNEQRRGRHLSREKDRRYVDDGRWGERERYRESKLFPRHHEAWRSARRMDWTLADDENANSRARARVCKHRWQWRQETPVIAYRHFELFHLGDPITSI